MCYQSRLEAQYKYFPICPVVGPGQSIQAAINAARPGDTVFVKPGVYDTVTGLLVTGFPGNGVFGYGTAGLSVTRVVAINDGGYGISRFVSTRTLFADDTAIGNDEAGCYVGDSPQADTVVRDDRA